MQQFHLEARIHASEILTASRRMGPTRVGRHRGSSLGSWAGTLAMPSSSSITISSHPEVSLSRGVRPLIHSEGNSNQRKSMI